MVKTPQARLLIVDDEIAQMRALCNTLEPEGYAPVGFASPKQALQALADGNFDLVLTDLSMPEMNGIDFLKAAREIDPTIIGIVMTGHGSIDTAVAAMKAGALDYITKPFTLRTIRPVLDRALTIRSLRSENNQLRQAEEMVRRLNENLERCVEERTRQLTDANIELEAFAHSISHDLRAPLRSINAFTQMLRDEFGDQHDARATRYIEQVLTSAARMEGLIEDLMRLSRVNGAELRRADINVSQMVESILADFRAREPERSIDATIARGLSAKADPQLLRIALENLLGNAWKFTRNAPGARIEFGASDDSTAMFYVRDNGAGFNAEYAKDLFAPFRRLHSDAEFPGSGIGLSIVQRIIRRHGGLIRAEGSVGHGATFYFSIPRVAEGSAPDRMTPS